jgi:hypothetical protein
VVLDSLVKEAVVNPGERKNILEGGIDLARFLKLPVFFFDLDPFLERSGSLLSRDRDRLRSLCERQLEAISAGDTIVHAATGFYLIVQSATGDEATRIAERLNVALLKLFFGPDSLTAERSGTMYSLARAPQQNVSHSDAEAIEAAPGPVGIGRHSLHTPEPRDAYAELAMRGALPSQHVELSFAPVHDLVRGRSTTFFCMPAFCIAGAPVITGYRAFENVDKRELPYLDRAILAHALKFARRLGQAGVYTAVGVPVSFETLVASRGREIYREALRAAGVPDYPFVVLTIRDVPAGITASRLAEIVDSVRPLAKRVFVHLPDAETAPLNSGHLGADGFILSLSPRQTPAQIGRAADWLNHMCEIQTALSCIDQIESASALETVKAASIRFGQGAVFGPTEFRADSSPIEIEAFMRSAARSGGGANTRNVHRFGARKEARGGVIHRLS